MFPCESSNHFEALGQEVPDMDVLRSRGAQVLSAAYEDGSLLEALDQIQECENGLGLGYK